MKSGLIKRMFKIFGISLLLILVVLTILYNNFMPPMTDEQIRHKLNDIGLELHLSHINYKGRQVRVIRMREHLDTLLPTLLFVHGSPGSSMDFQSYLRDSTLNSMANMISYDRIGYGAENTGVVLPSLEEEVSLLHQVLEGLPLSRVIVIGYSYGGTVVMASGKKFRKKIVLAPSVRGELEPMFWAINLYKWRLTRPLVPKIFRAATVEKLRHVNELPKFDKKWGLSDSRVLAVHGKEDFIVPFENSLYLESILEKDKFDLIPLEEGDHSLIWTNFDLIKTEIIKSLKE